VGANVIQNNVEREVEKGTESSQPPSYAL